MSKFLIEPNKIYFDDYTIFEPKRLFGPFEFDDSESYEEGNDDEEA